MKRKSPVTNLRIPLGPGEKLSEAFANGRSCYKVIETDRVLGYVVSSGGPGSVPAVYPLYNAIIHMKVEGAWHMVASHERGDRLNDFSYDLDYQGCVLASITAQAIAALEARRSTRSSEKQTESKKRARRR